MKQFLIPLILAFIGPALVCFGQASDATLPELKTESSYNVEKDQTTIKRAPEKVSGEKDKYYSLHIAPAFSFPGQQLKKTPDIVDFELQTVVKGRLRTDLYVVFVIDGETVFLSSSRWAVKHPVPGRVWLGERLVFRMPYETYLKLANANQAVVKFDGTVFEFDDAQRSLLKAFAQKMIP